MPKSKLKLKALLKVSEIDLRKDFKQILKEILTIVAREMGAHAGSIILAREEKPGELEMAATFGLPDDYIERVYSKGVPIASSPSGVVFETGKYYLSSNLFAEPRAKPWQDLGRELGITAQIFMPLKQKGEVIGVLVIYMADPHEFTDDEISFVSIAAGQAAAIIEDARLYVKVLQKKEELEDEIAERERMEEVLRESEEKYRALFESAKDAIFLADETGKFIDINQEACESLGYSKEELLKRSNREIDMGPEGYEAFLKIRNGLAKEMTFEVNQRRKDGTFLPVEGTGSCFTMGGKRIFLAITRDITERKQAEKRHLQLIDELEVANKELRNFMRAASHDLKTPLRGITTLAQWLSTDYADKLDEEGNKRLDLMVNRAKRMHRLLDGILHYTEIGRARELKEEVNLNTVVSGVIDTIKPLVRDIELEVADELPTIYCDKTQMAEIFQNLLENAVRYMDKPKGRVRIGCTEEDGQWKFSVADNGPGIEERYHEKIFLIFQTLHSRDEVESTGVGLPIVKKIVELQDGKVWVESKVGEGSTLFFTIPKESE